MIKIIKRKNKFEYFVTNFNIMNEGVPNNLEKETEHIPTVAEVQTVFEQLLNLVKHEGGHKTERQFEDEKGLYLWTIMIEVEDGHNEYEYIRKGRYEKNENHGTLAEIETSICVTYYNKDNFPIGGTSVAKYLNGKWNLIP